MKKLITILIVFVLTVCFSFSTIANTFNKIIIGEKEHSLINKPIMNNGKTYISQEDVSILLDAEIEIPLEKIYIESVKLQYDELTLISGNVINNHDKTLHLKLHVRCYDENEKFMYTLNFDIFDIQANDKKPFTFYTRKTGIKTYRIDYEYILKSTFA